MEWCGSTSARVAFLFHALATTTPGYMDELLGQTPPPVFHRNGKKNSGAFETGLSEIQTALGVEVASGKSPFS